MAFTLLSSCAQCVNRRHILQPSEGLHQSSHNHHSASADWHRLARPGARLPHGCAGAQAIYRQSYGQAGNQGSSSSRRPWPVHCSHPQCFFILKRSAIIEKIHTVRRYHFAGRTHKKAKALKLKFKATEIK